MTTSDRFRRRWLASFAAFALASTLAYGIPSASLQAGAPAGGIRLVADPDALDVYADDFDRSDRDLDGDQAPTGHLYTTQRAETAAIIGGRLKFDIHFPHSAILYTRLAKNVDSYSVQWKFTGMLQHQNMVSGVAPVSFGNASFQLASYASPTDPADQIREGADEADLGTGVTWLVFMVFYRPDLGRNEYIALASNLTHGELLAPAELDTEYTQGWRFIDDDTVEVTLLDGTTRTITDPRLPSVRGTRIGTQKRENVGDTGDIEVLSVAASSMAAEPQPAAGAGLVFDGTPFNYAETAQPPLTSSDLDVTVALDDWAAGRADKILSVYGDTDRRTFYVGRTSANAATLGMSVGGATTVTSTGRTAMPAGAKLVRITRDASTGTIRFWTASSDAARSLPTTDPAWTVWKTRTASNDGVPVGPLDASDAPLRIGSPVGAEGWLSGTVRYVNVRDGIDGSIAAERDFLSTEQQTKTDSAGNIWQVIGEAWRWAPVPATAPGRPVVTGTTADAGGVSVAFSPGGDGGSAITGYTAQCVSTDGGTGRANAGGTSPVLVTGLTGGKQYHCRVRATNGVSTGPYSRYGPIVTVLATAPGRPVVTGTTPEAGGVSVAFSPGGDGGSAITGYTAQCVSTDGGTGRAKTGATSPVLVTGLTGGKQYHCRVRATNAVGTGPYSLFGGTVVVPG